MVPWWLIPASLPKKEKKQPTHQTKEKIPHSGNIALSKV
jgi:hypothetical protein